MFRNMVAKLRMVLLLATAVAIATAATVAGKLHRPVPIGSPELYRHKGGLILKKRADVKAVLAEMQSDESRQHVEDLIEVVSKRVTESMSEDVSASTAGALLADASNWVPGRMDRFLKRQGAGDAAIITDDAPEITEEGDVVTSAEEEQEAAWAAMSTEERSDEKAKDGSVVKGKDKDGKIGTVTVTLTDSEKAQLEKIEAEAKKTKDAANKVGAFTTAWGDNIKQLVLTLALRGEPDTID